jgi:peptidoglycan/LPS O-acetylase OafA/YrhL
MSPQSGDKLPALDGLRASSILLVLGCHLLPLGPKALRLNETAGAMGMSLFFALSGFLITSGLMKNSDVHEFVARRLTRILPLAYAYTMIVFLVFTFNPKALLWTSLFTVNYFTQYISADLTAHLWSLCVEIHFYLAIAVIVLFFGRSGLWLVWPACLAITLLRVSAGAYIGIKTHLRVDEILAGACVATVFPNLSNLHIRIAVVGFSALLWAISSCPFVYAFQYLRPYTTALLLLVVVRYSTANPQTLLASRPLGYIATISYALYIIHPATVYGWMNEGTALTKYLLKRPISLALTFILAHLSTFYWERPWQTAVKQVLRKRRQIGFVELGGSSSPMNSHDA